MLKKYIVILLCLIGLANNTKANTNLIIDNKTDNNFIKVSFRDKKNKGPAPLENSRNEIFGRETLDPKATEKSDRPRGAQYLGEEKIKSEEPKDMDYEQLQAQHIASRTVRGCKESKKTSYGSNEDSYIIAPDTSCTSLLFSPDSEIAFLSFLDNSGKQVGKSLRALIDQKGTNCKSADTIEITCLRDRSCKSACAKFVAADTPKYRGEDIFKFKPVGPMKPN